jgi:hypothetical protein
VTTAAPTNTLLLDVVKWDLCLDVNGDIAMASPPYALAQDAASECRMFQGDDYYDTKHGIPYFAQVLGRWPPLTLVRSYLVAAALLVPGVVSARAFFSGLVNRKLTGQVQVSDAEGATTAAGF